MKKKVLIIDDKPAIGQLLSLYLSAEYDFQLFDNAVDAYNWLIKGQSIDLLITDYSMPEMNGLELLKLLKQNDTLNAIPVLIISGDDNSCLRIELMEAGAEDFILKPFNPLELKLRIQKLLKS